MLARRLWSCQLHSLRWQLASETGIRSTAMQTPAPQWAEPAKSERSWALNSSLGLAPPPWKRLELREGNQTAPVWEISTSPFQGLSVHYLSSGLKFT